MVQAGFFAERIPPAMQGAFKKVILFPRKEKPPDERAEIGLPTVYKLAHGEVLLV